MDIHLSSPIGFHLRYLVRFSFSGSHPDPLTSGFVSGFIKLKMLK